MVTSSSPASVDAGFVEIGHVHLSQSKIWKKKRRQTTDSTQTKCVPEACTQPAMKRLFCHMAKNSRFLPYGKKAASVASLARPCLIIRGIHMWKVAFKLQETWSSYYMIYPGNGYSVTTTSSPFQHIVAWQAATDCVGYLLISIYHIYTEYHIIAIPKHTVCQHFRE